MATAAVLAALFSSGCVTTAPPALDPGTDAVVAEGVPALEYGKDQCAAGALASVLSYWGQDVEIEELADDLPVVGNGVLSVDLLIAARKYGFNAHIVEGSITYVEQAISRGEPLILMLRVVNAPMARADLYHYVVVDGWDRENELLRLHFGHGPPTWGRLKRIRRAWKATDNFVLHLQPRRSREQGEGP